MKIINRFFFFSALLSVSVPALADDEEADALSNLTEITALGQYIAESPTQSACFGYCAAKLTDSYFCVSAGASTSVQNSRYINIYEMVDGTATLKQKLSDPGENAFFGWRVAGNEDLLVVSASTAKKLFFFAKSSDSDKVYDTTPFYTLELGNNVLNNLQVEGTDVVYSANSGTTGIYFYSVDLDTKSVTFVGSYLDAAIKGFRLNNGRVAGEVKDGNVYYFEKDETNGWADPTPKQTITEVSSGLNLSECVELYDNIMVVGDKRATYVFNYDETQSQWVLSQTLPILDSYESGSWGYSVRTNGTYLTTCTSTSDANISNVDFSGYVYKISDEGQWELYAGLNPTNEYDSNNVNKVMSSCYMGDYFVWSNQTAKYSDGDVTNVGAFWIFDLTEAETTDTDDDETGDGNSDPETDPDSGDAEGNDASMIDKITADSSAATYYTLSGARVAKPTSGVYVKVVGGVSTKVLVK